MPLAGFSAHFSEDANQVFRFHVVAYTSVRHGQRIRRQASDPGGSFRAPMHVNAIVQTAAAHADVERQGVKRSTSWRDEDCDAPKRSRRVGTADLDSEFAQLDLYHETRERGVVLDHLYALEDLNQVSSNPQVPART